MTPSFVFDLLREYAENKGYQIDFASEYAEPGYSNPESGIIAFGDWNSRGRWDREQSKYISTDFTMPRIAKIFQKLGIEIEWEDEWTRCCECDKAVRTQPDSYGWTRSYWEDDYGPTCNECVQGNPEPFIEWLVGNDSAANTLSIDLSQHGYVKLEGGFENGLHHGQNDDPCTIAKSLRKMGVERFIFEIDGVGQFDLNFSVWVHKEEMDKIENWDDAEKKTVPGMSPAEICERGLREASQLLAKVPDGGGAIYAAIGEYVTGRRVSPEEFINGIK